MKGALKSLRYISDKFKYNYGEWFNILSYSRDNLLKLGVKESLIATMNCVYIYIALWFMNWFKDGAAFKVKKSVGRRNL